MYSATEGSTLTLQGSANGSEPMRWQWRRNGTDIAGAIQPSLQLAAEMSLNGASISVVATNGAGSIASPAVTLSVLPRALTVTGQPADLTITDGQSATFSVVAQGTAPIGFQWRRDGVAIPAATGSAFTLPSAAITDDGAAFDVVMTNPAGSVISRRATLKVEPAPVAPPQIAQQPANLTVDDGQTAEFQVGVQGSAPVTYQWRRNGADLPGAQAARLQLPAVSVSDNAARYSVRVANSGGTVVSSEAVLTVRAVAPAISAHPADVSTMEGATAHFSVAASGSAPLNYQWRLAGRDLAGATGSGLTVGPLALSDSGNLYEVRISNAGGSVVSRSARLTVLPALRAPAFTLQPQSLTVDAGQAATFSVVATGNPAPTIQWRRNGTNIPGATQPSYTFVVAGSVDNAASFVAVAANSQGSAVSNAAVLTVRTSPSSIAISSQPQDRGVTAGLRASFAVTAAGPAPLAYQWYRNGRPIAGATASTYTSPETRLSDSGVGFAVMVSGPGAAPVMSRSAALTVSPGAAPWNRYLWGYAGRMQSNSSTQWADTTTPNGSAALNLVNPDNPSAPFVLEAAGQAGPVIRDLVFQTEFADWGGRGEQILSPREGDSGWLVYTKGNRFWKVNLVRSTGFPQPAQLGSVTTAQICSGVTYLADSIKPDQSMVVFRMPPSTGGTCGSPGTRLAALPMTAGAGDAPIQIQGTLLSHLMSADGSRRGFLVQEGQQLRETDMRFVTVASLFALSSSAAPEILLDAIDRGGMLVFRDGAQIKVYDPLARTAPRVVAHTGGFVPIGHLGGLRDRLIFGDWSARRVMTYRYSDGQITVLFEATFAQEVEATADATVINTGDRLMRIDIGQRVTTLTEALFATDAMPCKPAISYFVCSGVLGLKLVPRDGGTTIVPREPDGSPIRPGYLWKVVGNRIWFSGLDGTLRSLRENGQPLTTQAATSLVSVKRIAPGQSDIDYLGADEWAGPYFQAIAPDRSMQIRHGGTGAVAVSYGALPAITGGFGLVAGNYYRAIETGFPQLVVAMPATGPNTGVPELFMVRANVAGLVRVTHSLP